MKSLRKSFYQKVVAFTLAEVLITLGIIGVIAAMTIPTLINKSDEQAHRSALKKAYSAMQQAIAKMNTDNGGVFSVATGGYNVSSLDLVNQLKQYVSYTKQGLPSDLFPQTRDYGGGATTFINGGAIGSFGQALILNDGSVWAFLSGGDCNGTAAVDLSMGTLTHVCSFIFVDVNGNSKPNQFGHDVFAFALVDPNANTNYKVVPLGSPGDGFTCANPISSYLDSTYGCTYPMLMNQSMP